MSAIAKTKPVTVPEFLDWSACEPQGKFELHDGVIVAMAPERVAHAHAKLRIANALSAAVREAGLPCEAFVDSLGVQIAEDAMYIPDALVNCGAPLPPEAMVAANPVIVAEVLSPSSRKMDAVRKLLNYFRVPVLAHYLTIDLDRREVIHHRRGPDGTIVTSAAREGTLYLDPPGISLAVVEMLGR